MASRAALATRSSSTRRARSPSGCGTGRCRPVTMSGRGLANWRADGGDARRFRLGIAARFGDDEVAAWRDCEQALIRNGRGYARWPGRCWCTRGTCPTRWSRPSRPALQERDAQAVAVPGREADQRVEYHLGARVRQGLAGERAGRDAHRPRAGLHRGGHVRRGVADIGDRPQAAQHRRLLRAVHHREQLVGDQPGGPQARLGRYLVLGGHDDRPLPRRPDRGECLVRAGQHGRHRLRQPQVVPPVDTGHRVRRAAPAGTRTPARPPA